MKHIHTFESFLNENVDRSVWNDDFYSEKKSLSKKYLAKPMDEIAIEAAKKVAKMHKIKFQDILKDETPSGNIRGSKSWDREGNIIVVR